MNRVATAAVLIPIVLVLVLLAPVLLLATVVAAVALITTREVLQLAEHYGARPMRTATYVYVVLVFAAVCLSVVWQTQVVDLGMSMTSLLALSAAGAFVFLAVAMKRQDVAEAFPAAATSLLAVLYVAVPLALLVVVRELWAGGFLVLYLLLVVWAGDTFAYYVGRAFGRRKLAPRVSPGKTWEGTAASFLGSIVVGSLVLQYGREISDALLSVGLVARRYAYLTPQPAPLAESVFLTAAINVAAQLGDLVESLIKRGAGVKDSGALLPGHGGMLDRIDALLFAVPVLWYYATLRVLAQGHL
ncbi:MAG: phosphatidate cytidylyltransferase [Terriglobales bacterium]